MDFYEDDDRYYENKGPSLSTYLKIIGASFGFLFGPMIVVNLFIFLIFMRTLRWKPKVTIFPLSILFIIMTFFLSSHISSLATNLSSLDMIKENFKSVMLSYLFISIMMGIITGFLLILYKAYELNKYPEFKHLKGWAYGFEYRPTPLDILRKKKNIESLKEGKEFDYEKAPIGVIESPVRNGDLEGTLDLDNANKASIVYRYYTEAMAHTLITGATGSGKALHVSTVIRCKEKGWSTIGKIEVGDTIYDESGNHTKVQAIYQPMTKDHYELTFDNGEIVKACGDHLWNIGDVADGNTWSTRDLLKSYKGQDYTIKHFIDGIPLVHKILRIRRIEDKPEDYLCFTVDSDSHLFLITKSLIPTHNTVTMLALIQNDILAGNPVCVIDFKKSPDLIYFLSKWAKENDREFFHFMSGRPGTYKNPYKDNQATYDPLSTGGATAKADMILNLRTWDTASEVFKKRTQDVLQSLFFLLERTNRTDVPEIEWDNGGMAQFVSALDLNNFKKMIEVMAKDKEAGKLSPGDVRRYSTLVDLYKELSAKTKSDLKAQIVELLSIARTLIVSNYGDWLATGASPYHIDLMKIATSKEAPIVLFSFNQQEEPEFAQYIGSIVMSDLSRVSALKNAKGDITPFGVYIDEFQTLDPVTVKDNLEKARSSRMYITLSLQSIEQIVSSAANQGEAMANAILDTCANFIFHDGSGFDTAEKMSKIIGKTEKYKYKTTSKPNTSLFKYRLMTVDKAMVSKDIEEDWLIPPSEFQSLSSPKKSNKYKATAYVINKSSEDTRFKRSGGALARKVHVVVDEETAKGVPNSFKKEIFVPQSGNEFNEIQSRIIMDIEENNLETILPNETISYGNFSHEIINNQVNLDFPDIDDNWIIEDIVEENIIEKEISSQLNNFNKLSMKSKSAVNKINETKEPIQCNNDENEFQLPKLD